MALSFFALVPETIESPVHTCLLGGYEDKIRKGPAWVCFSAPVQVTAEMFIL